MKKILALLAILLAFPALAANPAKVFISQTISHPALDQTRQGIIDSLAKEGFIEGKNLELKIENAQGNASLSKQIATSFVAKQPDIVVGIGTMASQSFANEASSGKTKLVFSSVTDPKAAGLLKNNITGVSNFIEIAPQLDAFKQFLPKMKRLGFIYNPGEANSASILAKLKIEGEAQNVEIIEAVAPKSSDLSTATINLITKKVDAIFVSNDNTALSGLKTITNKATAQKIPVFVSDIDALELGALAAYGPSQYDIGVQTGQMIAQVLKGRNINSIAVAFPKGAKLEVNKSVAKELGLALPGGKS